MKSFNDFQKVDEATKYVVHYTDSKGQHVNSSKAFDDKKKADAHAAKGNSIDKVGGKYKVKPMQNEENKARELARRALSIVMETNEEFDAIEESMTDSWKTVQSMDKGSATGDKDQAKKRLAYLNAVHDHHKKFGNDTKKVKGEIESLNRSRIAEDIEEQAPVAPTIDRKYIKGTPEHKAYKATKKPINGHPTNVKEESEQIDEVSDEAKANYIKAARKSVKDLDNAGNDEKRDNRSVKANNTYSSMSDKAKKMANEDVQELGEDLYSELHEVLSKDASASDFIHDFVKSDDPKFSSDSKAQRIKRALGAYYAKQNEELKGGQVKLDKNKNGKLDAEDFKKLRKENKTAREFFNSLLEYESDKSGRYVHTKGSYGKSYDSEKDDNDDKPKSTEKRGRGRPAGSKSGARDRSSTGKSYGGVATHSLNLPNSNK